MTATLKPRELACNACPNPANCSPTFCHFADASEMSPADRARHMAAREFYRPDIARENRISVGRAHLLTLADTPGNWWDALPWYGRLGTVVGVVLAAGLIVGYA